MNSAAVDVLQRQIREVTTFIAGQTAAIGGFKNEIALLKSLKPRPTFPSSQMEDGTDDIR